MYGDPRKVKDNKLSTRFNDEQHERLAFVADALKEQPSTLMRKAVMHVIDELYDTLQEIEHKKLESLLKSSACPVVTLKNMHQQPMNSIMQAQFA